MSSPRPLSDTQVLAAFGNPVAADGTASMEWQKKNLVYVALPAPLRLSWDYAARATRLKCHRRVASFMQSALEEIYDAPGAWATINDTGGIHMFRTVTGNKHKLSRHATAIAIDLDCIDNPRLARWWPRVHKEVKRIMLKHGFCWGAWTVHGGSFPWGNRDAMHWEFCDLSRLT